MEETLVIQEIITLLRFALENEDWTSVDESIMILQEELGIYDEFEESE